MPFVPKRFLYFLIVMLCILPMAHAQQFQVDIQIHNTETAADDYVTWAPTFCRMRVREAQQQNSFTVILENENPDQGGQLLFAEMRTPWPDNITATGDSLQLEIPGNGDWREFVIAGKFLRPSISDKDTVLVIKHDGVEVGKHSMMVRVRKNANELTPEERDRFLAALAQLHLEKNDYATYQSIHQLAGVPAHGDSAFLPWHRAFLLQLERDLQRIDASVTLPYWRFDQSAPNLFHRDFLGDSNGNSSDNTVQFSIGNPIFDWNIAGVPGIIRQPHFSPNRSPRVLSEEDTLAPRTFLDFRRQIEGNPHGMAHVMAGGRRIGWLASVPTAVRDPLFFLLHCNVDRLWGKWQRIYNRFDVRNESTYSPQGSFRQGDSRRRYGHYLFDDMWPWNGRTGRGGSSDLPQSAPGGPLLTPQVSNWGPPRARPRPVDMIDYMGMFASRANLGYCYDDIPYGGGGANLVSSFSARERRIARQGDRFLDETLDDDERLRAAADIQFLSESSQVAKAMQIFRDRTKSSALRISALQLMGFAVDDTFISEILQMVKDSDTATEIRIALAETIHQLLMFSQSRNTRYEDLIDTLRYLTGDSDQEVREISYFVLASIGDEFAQQKLLAALQEPTRAPLPLHKCVQLLALNLHSDHFPALHKALEKYQGDEKMRRELVRALGGYQKSHSKIAEIAANSQESESMRLIALQSLNANDVSNFPNYALAVVQDKNLSSRIHAYSVKALGRFSIHEGASISSHKSFQPLVSSIKERLFDADDSDVRQYCRDFLQKNDPRFGEYVMQTLELEANAEQKLEAAREIIRRWSQKKSTIAGPPSSSAFVSSIKELLLASDDPEMRRQYRDFLQKNDPKFAEYALQIIELEPYTEEKLKVAIEIIQHLQGK